MTALATVRQLLAQAAEGGAGAQSPGIIDTLLPMGLIFLVFYFLLIRPQQKQQKQMKEMLSQLQRDDDVITSGGIHGKIVGITEKVVTLEIAPNTRIKVQRGNIAGKKGPEPKE